MKTKEVTKPGVRGTGGGGETNGGALGTNCERTGCSCVLGCCCRISVGSRGTFIGESSPDDVSIGLAPRGLPASSLD